MKTIPANSTEAHTIVLHGLIHDLREVLNLISVAWLAIAVTAALKVLPDGADRDWVSAVFHAAGAGFSVWIWRDFRKRAKRYRTKRLTPATEARAHAEEASDEH